MAPSISSGGPRPAAARRAARRPRTAQASNPQDDLFKAVQLPGRHQCLAAVHTALGAGAQATAVDARGWPVLHCTAGANPDGQAAASAIAELVAQGADVNVRSQGGRNPTALHRAARNPSGAAAAAIIRALADLGADVRSKDGANGDEPLHWVAFHTNAEAVPAVTEALLAAGACANAKASDGASVLHVVAKHSSPAVAVAAVRALAQAGAAAQSRDNDGDEPLHCLAFRASAEGLPALVAALVEASGDVNARADDGASPLHSVARFASAAVAAAAVEALAEAGGHVSSKTTDGDQPLHWAVQHNSDSSAAAAAATALIAAGADPQAPNGKGQLPVELALARPDAAQCADLLRALLGEAAGEAAGGSGGGEAAGAAGPSNAAGEAAGGAAAPSGSSSAGGPQQVLRLAAAAVSQLAKRKRPEEPVVPECPLCMERPVCMTGACGHMVCESCAQQVRDQQCPTCRRPLGKMFKVFL